MIPVEAFIFDLDGTLIDSAKDIANSVHYIQSKMGVPLSRESDIVSYIGNGVARLMRRALPWADEREIEESVALFKTHYREHCLDHTVLYPQVFETLSHFQNKRMAVVTNKPVQISQYMLQQLKLTPYFSVTLGGDSTVRRKPHPEPVLLALQQLKVPRPAQAVVIGDSANDIVAGRRAGARTCGIYSNIGDRKGLEESRPDVVIDRMGDLQRYFC